MNHTNLQQIYELYLNKLRHDKDSSVYKGKESFYHSSRAGLCLRKHFYGTVQQIEGSEITGDTLRIFRIGTLIHEDIQNAVRWYADKEALPIFIEKELYISKYNVRGFIDLAYVEDDILYDIKTCNAYKWKMLFGRNADANPSENYGLQLATYGLWYLENYGALNGMKLAYYNKNTSQMRDVDVPMGFLSKAEEYWSNCYDKTYDKKNPPEIIKGESPVYDWECNEKYCDYFEICGGGIKGK